MSISFLALGDSYTIGEGVPIYDSFPYQTVQLLRAADRSFAAPEIVARTGWTTDELTAGMATTRLLPSYDFVSLLIGVNNEYRGRSSVEYAGEFEVLLQRAIGLAAAGQVGADRGQMQGRDRTFVLSIPDWGVSPFAGTYLPDAKGRDQRVVAAEIDTFNQAAEAICRQYQVTFLDITTHSRGMGAAADMFAGDGLHPSGKTYRYWAEMLARQILER